MSVTTKSATATSGNPGQQLLEVKASEIRVKGKATIVPSVNIQGRNVVSNGGYLKIGTLQDEDLLEGEPLPDTDRFVQQLKSSDLRIDLFTFAQKLPNSEPKYQYSYEWDNLAVIPLTTYKDWWDGRVEPSIRRAVRKSVKEGVVTKVVDFDDAFVAGIVEINNETPIRQGRPFWHYQKSFENVKLEHATFAERNIFIGAYINDELIGYIRMTRVNGYTSIVQILSKLKYMDKRPTNALVAKAVEVSAELGMSHLVYCNYVYNDPESTLTEFKKRNGFEMVLVPRYYVPLTTKGKLAMKIGLHRGIAKMLPKPVLLRALRLRDKYYARRAQSAEQAG